MANANIKRTFTSERWGEVTIHATKYANNGALAVQLTSMGDFGPEPLTTLSVNMAHGQNAESKDLPEGCFYAKDWSENEELAHEAAASGWFKFRDDIPPAISGYVCAEAWELLDEQGEGFRLEF
jgi:hypothetical protein